MFLGWILTLKPDFIRSKLEKFWLTTYTLEMTLDKEVLECDRFGVFPKPYEKPEEYVDRTRSIISASDVGDKLGKVFKAHVRGAQLCNDIWQFPYDKRRKAVEKVKKKYDCDLRWVHVFYGDLQYDPVVYGSIVGYAAPDIKINEFHVPRFVVMSIHFQTFAQSNLTHELVHTARNQLRDEIEYEFTHDLEEKLADEPSLIRRAVSLFRRSPKTNFKAWKYKMRLKAFGDKAGYVMIRTPVEEMQDFYVDRKVSDDPKETICIMAEKGNLRYQIMKEKLRL